MAKPNGGSHRQASLSGNAFRPHDRQWAYGLDGPGALIRFGRIGFAEISRVQLRASSAAGPRLEDVVGRNDQGRLGCFGRQKRCDGGGIAAPSHDVNAVASHRRARR